MIESPLASLLLWLHIAGGTAALAGALGAVMTQWFNGAHRWHVRTGLLFFWGMVALSVTALPLAWIASSLFLVLVAVFSFYMAWSGIRYAHRRDGIVTLIDRLGAWTMVAVGTIMSGMGGAQLLTGGEMGPVLVTFGLLAVALGWADLAAFRGDTGAPRGRERIAAHLRMMMGGTIAAITGFVVTNVPSDPAFISWLAPTVILVPILMWWGRSVRKSGAPSLRQP